jgi:hypothetical protein
MRSLLQHSFKIVNRYVLLLALHKKK